ncbi:MAG: YebC/PmpR family DNA-binding transcriptional regulator [Verrucomicrobia bacterium]|nr:MAG: YebC/PmpR family DNA-binding transcriptional regulator [Verrucomicrobiota bacterium]
MAGHNKWSKVKHIKAVADAKKGKIFSRLAKEITLAARSGGGDPDMNPRLRTILLKAREANMPSDNVERAIKKGTGELEGMTIEEITYEGYGPGGIAMIVQVATDNKNRAASEVRSTFSKHGGNLAQSGAVMFQFQHCGQFLIARENADEDTLMELAIEAGADDVKTSDEGYEILCPVSAYDKVAAALEEKGIKTESSELVYLPTSTTPVTDPNVARTFFKLQATLEDLDDVQNVFSNEEISDELAAQVQGG